MHLNSHKSNECGRRCSNIDRHLLIGTLTVDFLGICELSLYGDIGWQATVAIGNQHEYPHTCFGCGRKRIHVVVFENRHVASWNGNINGNFSQCIDYFSSFDSESWY